MDARFTLSYDGEALRDGRMDVRELAPALLSAGELIQSTNHLLNGDRAHVSLQVRSDFRRGSFEIDLVLVQNLIDQARQYLNIHPQVKDAKELLEILFFWGGLPVGGTVGLFRFVKWLRGRTLANGEITFINNGMVKIQFGDEVTTISETVLKLSQEESIRRHADGIVQPLRREGIIELRLDGGTNLQERVGKDEAEYFQVNVRDGHTLLENIREAVLEIVSLSFNQQHKWRFTDGTTKISACITDEQFWREVSGGLRFAKGDQVLVSLRTRTFRTDSEQLKSEYFVDQVIRHIPRRPPRQLGFDAATHN